MRIEKLGIYIETSVWNFLRAEDVPKRRKITERFFAESEDYTLFTSPLTLREISRASSNIREELITLIRKYNPEIYIDEPIIYLLAKEYVDKGIFPEKYAEDAVHVAFASYFHADILLSWNFKHIVKYKVKNEVKSVNILQGYGTPDIISPEEMIEYD